MLVQLLHLLVTEELACMSTAIGLVSYENCLAPLLDQKLVRYCKVEDFTLRFVLRGTPSIIFVVGNNRKKQCSQMRVQLMSDVGLEL